MIAAKVEIPNPHALARAWMKHGCDNWALSHALAVLSGSKPFVGLVLNSLAGRKQDDANILCSNEKVCRHDTKQDALVVGIFRPGASVLTRVGTIDSPRLQPISDSRDDQSLSTCITDRTQLCGAPWGDRYPMRSRVEGTSVAYCILSSYVKPFHVGKDAGSYGPLAGA